jgi:hypothetical protein
MILSRRRDRMQRNSLLFCLKNQCYFNDRILQMLSRAQHDCQLHNIAHPPLYVYSGASNDEVLVKELHVADQHSHICKIGKIYFTGVRVRSATQI